MRERKNVAHAHDITADIAAKEGWGYVQLYTSVNSFTSMCTRGV